MYNKLTFSKSIQKPMFGMKIYKSCEEERAEE
jgi:hypothetical protein